jgi:hypothetical protein
MALTEGRKYDSGKPEMALLPPYALEAVARVLTIGAKKYDRDNWKKVPDAQYRYIGAALRHINELQKGNLVDDETGEHHFAHAICCLMFVLDSYESGVPLPGNLIDAPAQSPTNIQLSGTAKPTTHYKTITGPITPDNTLVSSIDEYMKGLYAAK